MQDALLYSRLAVTPLIISDWKMLTLDSPFYKKLNYASLYFYDD
jgi:hypothetical protein